MEKSDTKGYFIAWKWNRPCSGLAHYIKASEKDIGTNWAASVLVVKLLNFLQEKIACYWSELILFNCVSYKKISVPSDMYFLFSLSMCHFRFATSELTLPTIQSFRTVSCQSTIIVRVLTTAWCIFSMCWKSRKKCNQCSPVSTTRRNFRTLPFYSGNLGINHKWQPALSLCPMRMFNIQYAKQILRKHRNDTEGATIGHRGLWTAP